MAPDEIKHARVTLKFTTRELAAALGVEWTTVSAWERGELFPTKQYVEAISALLQSGGTTIPRKAKGGDPVEVLRDPEVWELIRKMLLHPKLRAELIKAAERYEDS